MKLPPNQNTLASSKPPAAVTIITAVRNDYFGLKKTIDSVSCQTARSQIEFIVFDGASNDNTLEAAGTSQVPIDRILSEPDQGVYDCMNKAMALATGQYVMFLNAGDVLIDFCAIEKALTLIADSNMPDMAMFQVKGTVGNTGRFHDIKMLTYENIGNHQGLLVRTDVHKRFPFNLQYRIKADRDAMLRMHSAGHSYKSFSEFITLYDNVGLSSTSIYEKERENCLITRNHKCGPIPLLKSYGLRLSRILIYSITTKLGLDWTSIKAFRLVPSRKKQ